MRFNLAAFVLLLFPLLGHSQTEFVPGVGITFQDILGTPPDTTTTPKPGWQIGGDIRYGKKLYFQPGAFLSRSSTEMKVNLGNGSLSEITDELSRSYVKLRAMMGYKLVNSQLFKMRFSAGASYDLLLSLEYKDDKLKMNQDQDFNDGTFNADAILGFSFAFLTVDGTASYGLNHVFKENDANYVTYSVTIGLNFGGMRKVNDPAPVVNPGPASIPTE